MWSYIDLCKKRNKITVRETSQSSEKLKNNKGRNDTELLLRFYLSQGGRKLVRFFAQDVVKALDHFFQLEFLAPAKHT